MGYKVNKQVGQELAKMAKGLPRMAKFVNGVPLYKRTPMSGHLMNLNGARDENGNRYKDDFIYNANVLQYVNHMEELQRIYKMDGMPGCETYCAEVIEQQKRRNAAAANADISWHAKLVNKFKSIFK